MKSFPLLIFVALCLVYFGLPATLFAKKEKVIKAEVIKVIDGDSIKVQSAKEKIEIRLYGIDAPEYDQPFAAHSKKYVKKKLQGKNVEIVPVDTDRYGRLVAIVRRGDKIINEQLLDQGLAWYYPKYCKKRICSSWKKTNKKAKKEKKNIWSEPSPVAPWKWKYQKHKKN